MKYFYYYSGSLAGKKIRWFRLFGYGLCWKQWTMFGEREGLTWSMKINGWTITILKPNKR